MTVVDFMLPVGNVTVFRVKVVWKWWGGADFTPWRAQNHSKLLKSLSNCSNSQWKFTLEFAILKVVNHWLFWANFLANLLRWKFVVIKEVEPAQRLIGFVNWATRKGEGICVEGSLLSSLECQNLKGNLLSIIGSFTIVIKRLSGFLGNK